jgi:hypothetical protein
MLLREEPPVKEDVGLRNRKQKRKFDQPKASLPGQGPAKRLIIVKNKDLTPFSHLEINEYLGLKNRMARDLANLVRLHESRGDLREAENFRKRAAEISAPSK